MAPKKVLAMMPIFFGIMIISSQTFAQQVLDKAQFKFYYEYAWEFDTLTYNDTREDLIILQVGQNISKSYSYYTFQTDSLRATPDGRTVFRESLNKALKEQMARGERPNPPYYRRMGTMVYKDYPEGEMTVTDAIGGSYYIYRDELHSQNWLITDSIKTILDYTCQMAVSDFRGRRWIAWFAPDIPISDGPWKLSGLPGLIMEAYDAKKHYSFNIVGIEIVDDEPIVFSPVVLSYGSFGKHEETNRITFLRGRFRYRHNMPDIMNNQLGMDIFSASTPSSHPHDFIERDYW
ncbi:MAG: GLPGLI family protein [Bacteroidales bacterium]|nr:GLPGLI family protein [Bacteroidales bacterium]